MAHAPAPKRRRADDALPTICVLGATGAGKGSTLNSCFRTERFSRSDMFESDTLKPAAFVLPWRGTGELMRGVDLCGFSDSEGRDTQFIEEMVSYLRQEVKHVSCFLLLLNSQEARIGVHLKDMLVALKSVFGLAFMKNVLIGFTRWDYTAKGAILRHGGTKEVLSANVNGLLRKLLGHEHDCVCVFLDNTVNMCTAEELRDLFTCKACQSCSEELTAVVGAFEESLEAVRRAALANEPFSCADLEGTLAERDVGRDLIERERAALAQGEEAFACFSQQWGALGIEEPPRLECKLEAAARTARERLHQYLAAKTKPDLEHVMASVLDSFDNQVRESSHSLIYKNRMAASSFNRSLRMQLVRNYKTLIAEQAKDELTDPRQRFESVHSKCSELIVEFIVRCKGGALAWPPFLVLQDQLRMEQVDAREKILHADLVSGNELPDISESLTEAKAVMALLANTQAAPAWLATFDDDGQED